MVKISQSARAPLKVSAAQVSKENPENAVSFKSKDAVAKKGPKIVDIGNTSRAAMAIKAKPEMMQAKNAIPLRKVTAPSKDGGAAGKTGIPRPVSEAPRDWKKIHEQEELKKQKRIEALKRPTTKTSEFSFGHSRTRSAEDGEDGEEMEVQRHAEASAPEEEFVQDQGALQSILSNTGITHDAAVRKSMHMAAAQTENHMRDIKDVVMNLQALRARMSMHAGISTTSVVPPAASAASTTTAATTATTSMAPSTSTSTSSVPFYGGMSMLPTCAAAVSMEPTTPGRALEQVSKFQSLAHLALPSEKRRQTVAARPVSPVAMVTTFTTTSHAAATHGATGLGSSLLSSAPFDALSKAHAKSQAGPGAVVGGGGGPGASEFVIHSSIGAEGEQWVGGATFDTVLRERETQSTKAMQMDEGAKRASVYCGAARVPATSKKAGHAGAFATGLLARGDQSPQAARVSMYVPTPMQCKTPRGDLAVPTTPSVARMSMPAIRADPSRAAAMPAAPLASTFAAPATTRMAAPSVPMVAANVAPALAAQQYLGSVPAGADLDKLLDEALAAEEARTKALMASAMAIPTAAEKIAPIVRTAFVGTFKPVAHRMETMAIDSVDSWDAELAAITLLPGPAGAGANAPRDLPEPVSRQVEEPFDRFRPLDALVTLEKIVGGGEVAAVNGNAMHGVTHGSSSMRTVSAFKTVC